MRDELERHCFGVSAALQNLPFPQLTDLAETLLDCHRRQATVFILGNGGSAATASHFACDLTKGTRRPGLSRFRVMPLTDNVPLMTAWANDSDYGDIFAEQLAALLRPGDLVIAITASGNSPNVLKAMRTARDNGARTAALTGRSGGQVAELAEQTIRVPADSMEAVEDGHMVITHALCVTLRQRLREPAPETATP